MSSSDSSSSSTDEEGPATMKEPVKSSKPQKESASDSDFVDYEKNTKPSNNSILTNVRSKKVLHQSTPIQKSDITSLRLNFQQKLMGSNNKLAKLMQNKQNVTEKNATASPSPIKGILKTPSKPDLNSTHEKSSTKEKSKNNAEFAFSPVASSTQVEYQPKIKKKREIVSGSEDSILADVQKNKKKKRKETLNNSESNSSDDDEGKKNQKKQRKKTLNHSKNSSSSDDDKGKKNHKKQKKKRVNQRKSSSSDDSEDEKNQKSQQKQTLSASESGDSSDAEKGIKSKKQLQNEAISDNKKKDSSEAGKQKVGKHKDMKEKKKSIKHQSRQCDASQTSSDSEDTTRASQTKKAQRRDTSSSSTTSVESCSVKQKRKEKSHSPKKAQRSISDSNSSSDSSSSVEDSHTTKTTKTSKPAQMKQNRRSSSNSESDAEVEKSHKSPVPKSFSKSSALLRKFEADHKSLSKVEQHNTLLKIKSNEAIFLVQIPKSLDPEQLLGTKISLKEKTRVPPKSKKYDCLPSHETQDVVTIFTNTKELHVVKPAGIIKVQRHIKSKRLPDLSEPWSAGVSFPDNLKERHPLFGADYANKICLEEHIQDKLNAALQSYAKQKKKKKKPKNKDQENISVPKEEEIFKFLSQTEAPKESKKSKKKYSTENIFDVTELGSKKEKRKEKYLNTSHLEFQQDLKVVPEDSWVSVTKKKKHKKSKNEEFNKSNVINDVSNENIKNSKKRKSEKEGESSPKKKHRKKDQTLNNTSELINEMLLSESLHLLNSTKKKKKRKHSHGSVDEDEVNAGTSEVIPETKKKRHKTHKTTYD